jgi:hypothetical protein
LQEEGLDSKKIKKKQQQKLWKQQQRQQQMEAYPSPPEGIPFFFLFFLSLINFDLQVWPYIFCKS